MNTEKHDILRVAADILEEWGHPSLANQNRAVADSDPHPTVLLPINYAMQFEMPDFKLTIPGFIEKIEPQPYERYEITIVNSPLPPPGLYNHMLTEIE